jgi:hypothetical protein
MMVARHAAFDHKASSAYLYPGAGCFGSAVFDAVLVVNRIVCSASCISGVVIQPQKHGEPCATTPASGG